MKHKLKKGETFKIVGPTPHYIVVTYDSYSYPIQYDLEEKNIDWENVEDIGGYKSRVFIIMADGTEHILDSKYEANSKEPDLIQLFNDVDDIIWEYVY